MYNNDGSPTDRFEKLFMDSERRLKNKELNEKTSQFGSSSKKTLKISNGKLYECNTLVNSS